VTGWPHLLVSALLLVASPEQQATAPVATDARVYAVAYVEAMAASSPKAIALLKQYRDASAKQDGFVSIELFEQIGRPGHFTVFEIWRDQKAFDARDPSAQKQLRDALQPIRVSDYDQRPYKRSVSTIGVATACRRPRSSSSLMWMSRPTRRSR
jgi:quinol monooxygenase YgiN